MIKINLISEAPTAAVSKRKRPEFSLGAKQGDIILVAVLAIAIVVSGTWWFLLKSKRNDLKELERQRTVERNELQPFIDKVEELEAKRALLKSKVDVINDLKNKQHGPVRIMDEVSRALPELVWLTQLKLREFPHAHGPGHGRECGRQLLLESGLVAILRRTGREKPRSKGRRFRLHSDGRLHL